MAIQDKDLKEAHDHLQGEDVCTWVQDSNWENPSDFYTSCGHAFSFTEGAPEDNGMKFCCFCGKKLVQELAEGDQDES